MSFVLAFLAGIVSILSPCILPLLPILIGSGIQTSKYGIFGLPLGLAISFSLIGISLAYAGQFLGLDSSNLSVVSSILLIIFGLVLCLDSLQKKWILVSQNFSSKFNNLANSINAQNFGGQFIIGLLLGVAWTPCIGPTIGAAITLASKGQNLISVAITMILFAIGATLPVVIMTVLSKNTLKKLKPNLNQSGRIGKIILGILLIIWGIGLFFNMDKYISAWLLQHTPSWMFKYL